MSRILFYGPFNQRSRDTESLMLMFHAQGHQVTCLTQQEGLLINDFLNSNGVNAFSHVVSGPRSGTWYYLRQLVFFIGFCWKHKIEIVYSHLEPANLVASIAQYFIKTQTYLCRHHIDEGSLYKFDTALHYKITYRLARKIIVVSAHAKRYMIEKEGIASEKIIHINLAYNFKLFGSPEPKNIKAIREEFPAEILLLSACRLTTYKRPELSIKVVKKLRDRGHDAKLILLGMGEMQAQLKFLVNELGLTDAVMMPGYVSNVLEYIAAADFFLHPSILDSSCVVIKEAGLVSKPVIVCRGVGDFDDYVVHKTNGLLVDRDKFVEESSDLILKYHRDKNFLLELGEGLKKSILELFDVEKVVHQYDSLNQAK